MSSDDTYRRFFRSLDREAFSEVFASWMNKVISGGVFQIAIDGKTNRRTFDTYKDVLHMISAFASDARLVLAQCGQQNKGKENAPQNMAVIRHATLNMSNRVKTKRESVPKIRKKSAWDISVLERVLRGL